MRWVWRTVEVVRIQCNMGRQVESFVSIVRRDLLDRWFLQGLILPICYFFHLIIIILIIIISKPRPEARGKRNVPVKLIGDMAQAVRAHTIPSTQVRVRVPPMFGNTCENMWIKKPGCHDGHQKICSCTPEVNLKNPLHGVRKHASEGFETQSRHHPKSKTGVSVAPQK